MLFWFNLLLFLFKRVCGCEMWRLLHSFFAELNDYELIYRLRLYKLLQFCLA